MDLTGLKWSKNVNHLDDDKVWAYDDYKVDYSSRIFILNWKNDFERNACNPKKGELIILRQHAHITHIVKVFNNTLYDYGDGSNFSIFRLVQVVWMANNLDNLPLNKIESFPSNKEIFGCDVVFPRNGSVTNVKEKQELKEHWENQGGWQEFENHVRYTLDKFSGQWHKPLIERCQCE